VVEKGKIYMLHQKDACCATAVRVDKVASGRVYFFKLNSKKACDMEVKEFERTSWKCYGN